MRALPPSETMLRAFLARDPAFDGLFVAAVRSTGVFCRPTCAARKPRPERVELFPDAAAARRAGYRPCLRCRPLDPVGSPPDWARRLLERLDRGPDERLTDARLRDLGVDPRRARRWFLASFGMTFHAFERARRLGRAAGAIGRGGRVLEVGLSHGYESASGFADAFGRVLGASPRRGGSSGCLLARWVATPLGRMRAVASSQGLRRLEFADVPGSGGRGDPEDGAPVVPGRNEVLDRLEGELAAWFAGGRTAFTVPLDPVGTTFQRAVWSALLRVPRGATTTYAAIAREVGRPGAVRAVGRANGANPIAILVPCHRVVRSDGAVGGYGGEVWRKEWLLAHERAGLPLRDSRPAPGAGGG